MFRASAIAGVILVVCHAFAQPTRPEFEVASIKLNKSATFFQMIKPVAGGRLALTNLSVESLIELAYHLKDFQVSGAPPWLISERYDIEAKAEGNPQFSAMLPMLQTLLRDRMQLKFHNESADLCPDGG
jgi:uncharacterized protein (TIGR03435 family)